MTARLVAFSCIASTFELAGGFGTAEEKIPYEQMCLQHACETYGYDRAVVVMAGPGWKHDQRYVEGVFDTWMNTPNVLVLSFSGFINEFNL